MFVIIWWYIIHDIETEHLQSIITESNDKWKPTFKGYMEGEGVLRGRGYWEPGDFTRNIDDKRGEEF